MTSAELIIEVGGAAGQTQRIEVPAEMLDRSLTDLLALHDIPLNARCGQRGWCRGCQVELRSGSLRGCDGAEVLPNGLVRSCQMRLSAGSRVVLGIPEHTRLGLAPQVGETFVIQVPYDLNPLFDLSDGRDTALAVDIGTTTVVVMVVDLHDGMVLARAGGFNAQIRFGDNVLTRIGAASSPAMRQAMRRALVEETLGPLAVKACERAGRSLSRLVGAALAGNTTMLHILADEDPTSLGVAPFTARFLEGRVLTPTNIGWAADGLDPELPLQLLPGLSAYVGADITAGVYASGMIYDETPSLLVDMGTNGEIVLHASGRLIGCATAAGPAFEGAGLTSGTRAHAGAVEGIQLNLRPFELKLRAIGGQLAATHAGVCGSAYVDFLASGRACGFLRENGRFDRKRWQEVPAEHQVETEDGYALRLAGTADAPGPQISEVDVALLLQAKAAIGAGIETLLEHVGITAKEVGRVYLAGGFGMHIDVVHAIRVGLLPGFEAANVQVVGNTALGGAVLTALDRSVLAQMEALRERIEVIELNLEDGFEDRYIDHLSLPGDGG